SLRHPCVFTHRDRCRFDDKPTAVVRPGGLCAVRSAQRGGLRPVLGDREAHPVCDIGDASPFVSILSSYSASGAKGSVVVRPGGFTTADGCTFITRTDLLASPGLGKAYRSVKSRRASPRGNPKSGPE